MRKLIKVVLDCDDVLFKCNSTAVEKLNKEIKSTYKIEDIDKWGILNNDLDKRLQYFADPEFIGNLPLYEGAQSFVKKLCKIAEVCICTNVQPQCAGVRINAIIKAFPEINPANILIGGRKDMLKADIMLDDCMANLEKGNCSYPVLMRRPWNKSETGVLSVSNYDSFLQLVNMIKSNTEQEEKYASIVLVGPSGSNKNRLAQLLCKSDSRFVKVKSYTDYRGGENSFFYNVCNKNEFTEMLANKEFFETSSYGGYLYGTKKEDVQQVLDAGKIPVMVLDINGAITMKNTFSSLNVFVKTSKDCCVRSILNNKSYTEEEKVQRILSIDSEYKNEELCDLTLYESDSLFKLVNMFSEKAAGF